MCVFFIGKIVFIHFNGLIRRRALLFDSSSVLATMVALEEVEEEEQGTPSKELKSRFT